MHNDTNASSPTAFRGILLILATVMLFSLMDTLSKYLARYYPVSMILWSRYLIHTLLFLVLALSRRGLSMIRTERLPIQLLRGVLLSAAAFCFVSAIAHMPLAEATAIAFIAPILVTLLAVLFLKEKVETGRWVAIACAFAGVLVIIRPGSEVFTWAAMLPLTNAMFFAAYQILTRSLSGRESPYAMAFYPGLVGLILFSCSFPQHWVLPQSGTHLLLLTGGGFLGGASHLIMIKAFELTPASRLAPFSYTQLIWITLCGYFVFGNLPDHWSLAGIGILIASGIYCANHQRLSAKEAGRMAEGSPTGD